MITLENNFLKVDIKSHGAELASIYSKKDGLEYLWQAGEMWPRHAPHLFPVVGACLNDTLLIDGQASPMVKHGFSRDMMFRRLEATPTHVKFSLHYNKETLQSFPYKFEFQVLYDLFDRKLRISYKVINLDSKTIYFSIGAHPAFNIPLVQGEAYEDYYLEFDKDTSPQTHLLDTSGLFTGATHTVELDGSKLHLNRTMFDNDALVMKDMPSRKVTIKNTKSDKSLCVSFPHFNYLGIWAKPGADFVCIEPWLGCADAVGKPVDVKQKEGIQHADVGHVFETEYCIEVGA